MAVWQSVIATAASAGINPSKYVLWHSWFNIFNGEFELIQDSDPIASLVCCQLKRGISIHLYDELPIGRRWARIREFAADTSGAIDHLMIAGNLTLKDASEITDLIQAC